MKAMSKFLFSVIAVTILCLWSCKNDDNSPETISFIFEFSSFGGPVPGDVSCGQPPFVLVRQEGEGVDELLGDFKFVSQFCNNLNTGEYFGGPSAFGYFEAENGDRLNMVAVNGQILPSTKQGYDLMFQDEIRFESGTGQFEGVVGTGMTDSYVILALGRTDHVWTGTLTF